MKRNVYIRKTRGIHSIQDPENIHVKAIMSIIM